MKRIVTIQDISCVGKCSLTVALPVISAMGVEAAVVPTAVLSTHTAFQGFTFRDLTSDIKPISEHWKKEKIDFDAVYTGYLGSFEQLNLVSEFFTDYKTKDNIVFVDPVMADNGKLYPGFTQEFADEMAKLCGKADIIVPNLTEASFMLGIPYAGDSYDEEYIMNVLKHLSKLGVPNAVLTGVSFKPDELGVMAYNAETDEFFSYFGEKIPVSFHGTGDIFASTCVGALMNGFSLNESLKIAVDYTVESIRKTVEDNEHRWYGVNFESAIPYLVNRIAKN
ncbi:MAG TPA: pyridoxamine kinase [Oscillospiraceae bacterium]|nr:pyridoxamine kinase [Oscillospiraceae bacterium]